MSVISFALTRTMSGRTEVTRVLSGMMDTGLSLALKPGRTAYRVVSLSRCSLMPCTRVMRAQSCRQVYLPCCSASGQLKRMWWMVGCLCPQRGQLGSVLSLQHLRFSGVGRSTKRPGADYSVKALKKAKRGNNIGAATRAYYYARRVALRGVYS